MTRYRCYLLDAFDRIRHVEAIDCDDDAEAHARARALLGDHSELRAIELWDGARRVLVDEPSPPAGSAP